ELRAQALAPRQRDRTVVEGHRGQVVDRVPGRVAGDDGIRVGGDESEIAGRQLPLVGVTVGIAARLELLEVGELAHVDLGSEVPANRLLKRLARLEIAAGQRPGARERLPGALPEEGLQPTAAHAEDDGERHVRGARPHSLRSRSRNFGKLVHWLLTERLKLPDLM